MLRIATIQAVARVEVVAIALAFIGLGTLTAREAAADDSNCVDTCVAAFGVTFSNSRGDVFVLKDCATSDISGTTFCAYRRFSA